ncbi:fibrinogen-like YCDxxxxGGGW domain-containing protein [Apibacter raozihei]|uniref:fibrinogen-like YCDxxxxGGGW domain-containing protein n=1 Tax=Apibacter raozihei TaxID=2500547 RepID=UPI001E3F8A2C|nr:fibrinogen-like YCDxxxxGGGW domain-containing protein [Apibacter raozihei]
MKKLLLTLLPLFIFSIINAQVGIGTDTPDEKAALHIVSPNSNQGVLIPSMTTAQRDANITPESTENGLLIFNTDQNCYNYYQATDQSWLSICGNYKSSTYTVDCSKIKVSGKYTQGSSLNDTNYITIPVTVTSTGTYYILAKTNNGYYFEKSGMFPNTGTYTVTLKGTGIPTNGGSGYQDTVSFEFLGLSETCSSNPVTISVASSQISYTINCENFTVNGTYLAGVILDPDTNTVTVPLTNVDTGGQVIINSSTNNGVNFTANEAITTDSNSITLVGSGTPLNSGSYTFTFKTNGANLQKCILIVDFDTRKGTFADPADRCLDIYNLGKREDGEYWIKQGSGNVAPVKTYCDMTNGGYTLVWSYSELTAYSRYSTTSRMEMSGDYRLNQNLPINNITDESGGTINYYNFRLGLAAMSNINDLSNSVAQLRARIAENPTDMEDAWAKQNYLIFSPTSDRSSPITSTTTYYYYYPISGKIFNQDMLITHNPDSRTYAGATLGDAAFYAGGSASYPDHININNNVTANNNAFVSPDGTNTLLPSNLDNTFGYFGQTQVNHHFGKCGGSSGDETSFATATCTATGLYPHTNFNGGEGRILQWFVK